MTLSNNSFSAAGVRALADAVIDNRSLRRLPADARYGGKEEVAEAEQALKTALHHESRGVMDVKDY